VKELHVRERHQLSENEFDRPAPAKVSTAELSGTWIVVCVHNRPDVTMPCLRALHERTPREVGILIVDDASDAYTKVALRRFAKKCRAEGRRCGGIRHDENVRYTRAINSGFSAAFESGATWAISLNSDTLVTPGWIEEMLLVGRSEDVGMVCPYMSNAALLTFGMLPGVSYIEMAARLAHIARGRSVDAVTPVGACMAVRRELWAEIGPFDVERCPQGYGEECHFWAIAVGSIADRRKRFPERKLSNRSWRTLVACGAYIYHLSHASYGRDANELEKRAVIDFKSEHGNLLEARRIRALNVDPQPELIAKLRTIRSKGERPRLYFYLPHIQLCGGMLALANIVNGLIERDIDAAVAYSWDAKHSLNLIPMRAAAIRVDPEPSKWVATGGSANAIVMATAWFTGDWVTRLSRSVSGILPGAFVQDLESLFVKQDGRPEYPHGPPQAYLDLVRGPRSVVNSNWVRKAMRSELHVDAAEYIPIGVDTDLFYDRGLRSAGKDRVQVLAMYRPETPRRGDALLREIYGKLHAKFGKHVDLATYGSYSLLGDVPVTQLGILPQSELARHMATTHVLIEPSSVQGWGMPGQEAMASGACLVSTDNGGIGNYGQHEKNCLIANASGMFAAVCRAIEDRPLRIQLGMQAVEDMQAFAWSRVCDRWAEVVATWWRRKH